jgi:NADH-quinone oxidoreductase subunit N
VYANFIPATVEFIRLLPEIILLLAGTLCMTLEAKAGDSHRRGLASFALISILLAMGGTVAAAANPGPAFQNMMLVDGFATFFRMLILVVGALAVLCSAAYLAREQADSGDYYALLLFSLTGQSLMVAANELIMIFIGLETASIATYVLAGYLRDDKRNNEAAIKYFLLGSFATAFLLYGIAWIYGITGATNLEEIRAFLRNPVQMPPSLLIAASAALMFVGFAFKVSAAPFQAWAPDVYQGAPAPVTAFMSAGPKAAAFAVLLRVYSTAFADVSESWVPIIWMSALITMIVGNYAAITQSNIKRMLAYSSIAHAGYVMVAVTAHSEIGIAAAMFYLTAYAFMNVGAFAVVTWFSRQGERYVNIDDLAGFARQQPVIAAIFSLFLLSFIGVPLTGGFFGKFYIFKAAIDSKLYWLTVIGLLNSAVAAYYYLRVLVVMYFHEPGEATSALPEISPGIRLALYSSAVATLVLGIFPSLVLNYASRSAVFSR